MSGILPLFLLDEIGGADSRLSQLHILGVAVAAALNYSLSHIDSEREDLNLQGLSHRLPKSARYQITVYALFLFVIDVPGRNRTCISNYDYWFRKPDRYRDVTPTKTRSTGVLSGEQMNNGEQRN